MLLIGVQIHRKFCVMFSTYCTSNFRRNAFSVITAYDLFVLLGLQKGLKRHSKQLMHLTMEQQIYKRIYRKGTRISFNKLS